MMTHRFTVILIAGCILTTLLVAVLVGAWSTNREQLLRARHELEVSMLQADWARQAIDRERAILLEDAARVRKHRESLEAALGGHIKSPSCDPDLTIGQMLEATSRACTPAGANVSVSVDRFTEFEIKVFLNRQVDTHSLAEILLCIMRANAPFTKSVLLIWADKVIAELDEHTIGAVKDWTSTTPEQLERMFRSEESAAVPVTSTGATQRPDSDSDSATSSERQAVRESLAEYDKTRKYVFEQLNRIVKMQDSLVELNGFRNSADFKDRVSKLSADGADLKAAREFLLNSVPEYRRLLQSKNVDPLVVKILCRDASERGNLEAPYLTALLDAIGDRSRGAARFLEIMQSQFGNWSVQQGAGMINFESSTVRDIYRQAKADFEEMTRAVSGASESMAAWNKAQSQVK
jgi:hypothetical protein